MAFRPVFVMTEKAPYVNVIMSEFSWNGGFAVTQKQKNIVALHKSFLSRFPKHNPLEISSKSLQEIGVKLSAFNLRKNVPSKNKSIPVECIFQGGKVFSGGGPFIDMYDMLPREAKRDERLKSSGLLRNFYFEGEKFPLTPKTAFYDWLYINAIMENKELADQILQFDSFTDIEFNPDKSINCQARAAAMFVSLSKCGLLDRCADFNDFVMLLNK